MHSRKKSKNIKKAILVVVIIFFILGAFVGSKIWKFFSIGVQVVTNKEIELKKTEEKRINILLLGVGGGTHEGPDLTDTIIFASIDPNTKKVVLVSIPRDLWVPDLNAKINTAYYFGENKKDGEGLKSAKEVVSKILGQKIDYAVRIDFDGFVKAVDKLDGLDVEVERTFDDYAYPITGNEDDPCGLSEDEIATLSARIATGSATELESFPCRYEHLHFDRGIIHMDGETALKYVRSRHALGPEGSDFARSKRQEKIIAAFKNKVFSLDLLLNPVKIFDLIDVVKDSIDTDIKEDEYDDFIRLAQDFKSVKIESAMIDTGDEQDGRPALLVNPITSEEYRNQWVLIPKDGNENYTEIQEYVECRIDSKKCKITPTPKTSPTIVE